MLVSLNILLSKKKKNDFKQRATHTYNLFESYRLKLRDFGLNKGLAVRRLVVVVVFGMFYNWKNELQMGNKNGNGLKFGL